MRFDPFREFDRLTQEALGSARVAPGIPMDAYRKGEEFVVHLDLPGVDAESIDLTVEKNVLTVRAERTRTRAEGEEWMVAERPHGTFTRQLFLGDTLDADRIEAGYEHGVLTVRIPVAERARPRRVEISTSGGDHTKAVAATASANN